MRVLEWGTDERLHSDLLGTSYPSQNPLLRLLLPISLSYPDCIPLSPHIVRNYTSESSGSSVHNRLESLTILKLLIHRLITFYFMFPYKTV